MADDGGNMRFMAGIEKDAKAKTMKDASLDDLLGEISARMEDKEQAVAFMNKRVNEFAKSNARLTEEKQRLKAADAERKRLLVRNGALEEECSRLRGRLSQETKKRREAEESARDATDRCRQIKENLKEINVPYNTALDKDGIIREQIDRMLTRAERLPDVDERRVMKSMITDVFRNNLTEEQWERLADLDLRDTREATQVNVWGGGVYNAHVERQALDAPAKRTRRNGEQGWLINR